AVSPAGWLIAGTSTVHVEEAVLPPEPVLAQAASRLVSRAAARGSDRGMGRSGGKRKAQSREDDHPAPAPDGRSGGIPGSGEAGIGRAVPCSRLAIMPPRHVLPMTRVRSSRRIAITIAVG